jgi:lipopolysaccharide/colanic/teichoic acid biosynthesis glycosyltransferase
MAGERQTETPGEIRLDDPSATAPPVLSESALERYRRISRGLMATDGACIVVALLVGCYLRYDNRPMPTGESLTVVFAPLLWLAAFQAFGLYAPQHLSPAEEFRRTFGAASVGIVLLVVASYWSHSNFSRVWMGATWILALLLELLTRRGWRRYQARLKGSGRLAFRTLIVGTSAEAGRLAHILDNPASGFLPLSYVQGSDKTVSANTLPLLGDLEQLQTLIRDHAANCLFVASSALTFEDVSWVAQAARKEGVEVRITANLPQMLTSRLCFHTVGSTIAISLRAARLTGRQVLLKRAFDLVVASIALVLATPLFAAIALAVRLSSRGPVLFRQARVTKDGKVFQMHKFRTMRAGADRALDTSAPFFKVAADSRLTPVGRLIRRTSLDELPQLWGRPGGEHEPGRPRPLPANQVAANVELLRERHEVQAGVTGWWQINAAAPSTPRAPWPLTASTSRTGRSAWTSTSWPRPSGRSSAPRAPSEHGRVTRRDHAPGVAPHPAYPGRRHQLPTGHRPGAALGRGRPAPLRLCGHGQQPDRGLRRPGYNTTMEATDLATPDGMPLVWGLRLLGVPEASRVYGPDLTLWVCEEAACRGIPVGFYGGQDEVLDDLTATLSRRWPGLRVAYRWSPPYRALPPRRRPGWPRTWAARGRGSCSWGWAPPSRNAGWPTTGTCPWR